MQTRTIEVGTPDGPMPVYEAVPAGGSERGMVVIQEAFGVNEHIEDVTRRFADAGFHAVAPHLFHRSGGGTAPYDDFSKVLPLFQSVSDETILTDVDAVLGVLAAAGVAPGRTGVVGFCMGGRAAFLVAARRAIGAAVGFYGGGIVTARFAQFPALVDEVATLRTPWLGFFGDRDEGIPVDDVEALRSALASAPVATDIVRYPDAEHGFFCDARPAYHPERAADAWPRALAWFDRHLV